LAFLPFPLLIPAQIRVFIAFTLTFTTTTTGLIVRFTSGTTTDDGFYSFEVIDGIALQKELMAGPNQVIHPPFN
jgi:hypothetical protein